MCTMISRIPTVDRLHNSSFLMGGAEPPGCRAPFTLSFHGYHESYWRGMPANGHRRLNGFGIPKGLKDTFPSATASWGAYMNRERFHCAVKSSGSDMVHSNFNGSLALPPAPDQRFRAFFFYAVNALLALPLFLVMLVIHPFVLLFDKHKRKAHHLINKVWARHASLLFYKTEIEGLENLPGPDEAAVYVSNHQSFLDIYALLLLGRPFKFISKKSIFFIPIVGWSMFLTGHIPLSRMDTKSQIDCLKHCVSLVRKGVPVFFFPEGTRTKDGKMGNFKKGAFTVAVKGKVPVVPLTLIGTRQLMPSGMEDTLKSGLVKLVIHQPLYGNDADELCKQARSVIAECLVNNGHEF